MRVTVQIDDDRTGTDSPRRDTAEAAFPVPGSAGAAPSGGGPSGPGPSVGGTADRSAGASGPSAELAARAARLGAISAGAAPPGPPGAPGSPGFLPEGLGAQSAATFGAPGSVASDHSGGAAPASDQLVPPGITY